MAATLTQSLRPQRVFKSISKALASAFLEWILIFLLFLDAMFSYLIAKFARYCELQVPCLLCSRLDHIIGNKEDGIYQNLICKNHKLEISSLVLCRIHNKLINVHGMCKSCLFSFATVDKSNAETYRLLVGKLGSDQDPLLQEQKLGLSGKRKCSCCYEQYIYGGRIQKLLETKSIGSEGAELDLPLSIGSFSASHMVKSGVDNLSHIEYTKVKINSDNESEVPLSDDDDDDDAASALIRERDGPEEDFSVRCIDIEPRVLSIGDDLTSEIVIDPASAPEAFLAKSEVRSDEVGPQVEHKTGPYIISELICFDEVPRLSDAMETPVEVSIETLDALTTGDFEQEFVTESEVKLLHTVNPDVCTSIASSDAIGHVLEEPTSQEVRHNAEPSTISELISFDEVPPSPNVVDTPVEVSRETLDAPVTGELEQKFVPESEMNLITVNTHGCTSVASSDAIGHVLEELKCQEVRDKSEPSTISEFISFDDVPTPSHVVDGPVEDSRATLDAHASVKMEQKSLIENSEIAKSRSSSITQSETGLESNSFTNNTGLHMPNHLELGDAYKLAVRGRQLSGKLSEQRSMKESTRLSEDLKLLFSNLSFSRGTDLPLSDISPRLTANSEELSGNSGIQILQRRISLERNLSGLSLDGSIVSEIEGESVCERLNRQIEHDKKIMGSLYKELEEERNASSVAVNQAMAMITRLQEEKSTLQMEALQCVRMMEEQAAYDMEDLQRANELLLEKEREIQDLEAELKLYRKNYGEISAIDTKAGDLRKEGIDASFLNNSAVM